LSDPGLILRNEDSLFEIIERLASRDLSYFGLLEFVRFEFVTDELMKRAFEFISEYFEMITIGIWGSLGRRLTLSVTPLVNKDRFVFHRRKLESDIVSDFPDILRVIGDKQFGLLYRGTRDGFRSADFHRCCDNRKPTLTLIMSDNGSIFGGYTPFAWASQGGYVSDSQLQSFIFTIKNPHNLSPKTFAQHNSRFAISNASISGPTFGGGNDIWICDKCNTTQSSYTNFGHSYTNNTGLSGQSVLTGSSTFLVKNIEVFEVTG
jgi:hypothetical protein